MYIKKYKKGNYTKKENNLHRKYLKCKERRPGRKRGERGERERRERKERGEKGKERGERGEREGGECYALHQLTQSCWDKRINCRSGCHVTRRRLVIDKSYSKD